MTAAFARPENPVGEVWTENAAKDGPWVPGALVTISCTSARMTNKITIAYSKRMIEVCTTIDGLMPRTATKMTSAMTAAERIHTRILGKLCPGEMIPSR